MHPNLYMSLEYRPIASRPNRDWCFFLRLPDMGSYNTLFALLGCDSYKVDSSEIDPQDCLTIKGFPDDVVDESINEDAYVVNNEAVESDIGDLVETRFCSTEEAQSWVDSGQSQFLHDGYFPKGKVTDPECYCQSWASYEEFTNLVENVKKHDSRLIHILNAFLAAMTSLQQDGYMTRVVYYFE
jgi:hypothetical protein